MQTATGARYSVYLCDVYGAVIADASGFTSLSYTRVVNGVGELTLTLPGDFPISRVTAPDGWLQVWRRPAGSSRETLDTDTVWLITGRRQVLSDGGQRSIEVRAQTPLRVLGEPGRFVDDYAGGTSAQKTAAADDMIKAIVREQAGASAAAARSLSSYLSVAADTSAAPSLTKAFAWRPVLAVLQEIADQSAQAGTYLAFDIVAPTPSTLELRTYTGQRGADRRYPGGISPLILGPDFGSVAACELDEAWEDEVTYSKAGGQGEGAGRLTGEATDTTRAALSPFARREVFTSATGYSASTGLSAEAQARVRAGRPRRTLSGKVASVRGALYGVDWNWGDYVTVQALGVQLDCRIDAVSVSVSDGKETVSASFKGDV